MWRPQLRGATSVWSALLGLFGLFASGSTLVCCALPALLVGLGAGAALSGLVSALPQLVWLSAHKLALFGVAGVLLLINGVWQWRNRTLPCPIELRQRDACLRTRRTATRLYGFSVAIYAVGGWFAFVQPWLTGWP